jgi:DNA-binding NarL/FixJ family response regulator
MMASYIVHNEPSTAEHNHYSRYLSEREQQILQCVARGQTSKDIAQDLYLSESSVRTYWYRVLTKLNATNKAEALVIASQQGLLDGIMKDHIA